MAWSLPSLVLSEEKSHTQNKTLEELEPYTAYKCAGKVTRNNVTVWTPAINVKIQCGMCQLQMSIAMRHMTPSSLTDSDVF